MPKRVQGVYGIFNEVNGRVYVGASRDIINRFRLHNYYLRSGGSLCAELQKDFNTGHRLTYVVLERSGDSMTLNALELKWINKFPCAYNERKYIHGIKPGKRLSCETRDKMSKARKGVPKSDDMRKRLSESRKGIVFSQNTLNKMSRASKGRVPWNKGKKGAKASIEARKHMSEAQKARWAKQ